MKKIRLEGVEGKVVVVTGAAGVLCSSVVEDLLRHGAKVALVGRTRAKLEKLAKSLARKGLTDTLVCVADVLDRDALEAAKTAVLKKWRRVDALVNGAGGNHPKGTTPAERLTKDTKLEDSFFGLGVEGFDSVNRLNLVGTVLPCQVFCREMLKRGGAVLNFCSMAAYQPLTKVAAYGAAKAGVKNFTEFLATHLAPAGVRVNAVAPGFFITDQNRFLMLEKDGKTLTARGNKVIAKTPMRKFGRPSDLHGAVRFLLSDEAGFVTGVTLPVDGGFVCCSGV
ncbi:MAG: SDR family oxidoreductase [Kiritimatiellae bacterium]|nr:SDR family oxidoreductase [Kiritimatiellia bacterium]